MANLNLLWAILAQILSTSLNFIGMTIQKKAAGDLPKIGEEANIIKSTKNFILNKKWIFGFLLNLVSVILSAVALALAAISIVQPFYGFGLIVLVIFSRFYLKEKITLIDIIGVLIGIAGIILIGVTATPPDQISYKEVLSSFLNIHGIIFLAIFLGVALIFHIISEKTPKR
ncbi:MAG: DMT family transporter, partial [Candidatus Thorarchaeota archaeon]